MVRTRFAPSPTGSLHVGNARIAVLNWLFARHHAGRVLLRIEDTDVERNQPGSDQAIYDDLRWLGLDWDEGAGLAHEGPHAPYRQSERGDLYRAHADRLLAQGRAYYCFCTDEELAAKREAALAQGEPPKYDRTCLRRHAAQTERMKRSGAPAAIRFEVPAGGDVEVNDAVRGTVRFPRPEIGDFILLRSDALPTYNFAVVVDDVEMDITHVIRGAGHLSNTPRQVLLYDALGAPPPVFAHAPTVLGPDRHKLSKRHGAQALAEYRAEGYHPDAIVNYLSLLSWSSPTGEEVLTRAELVEQISLERIGVADVVFDPVKLRWLSARHIDRMPLEELVTAIRGFIDRDRFPFDGEQLSAAVAAIRSHLSTFSTINEYLAPFARGARGVAAAAAAPVLRAVRERLAALDDWTEAGVASAVKEAGAAAGVKGKALYEPVRRALTDAEHGPPLPAVLFVRGRADVLRALDGVIGATPDRSLA